MASRRLILAGIALLLAVTSAPQIHVPDARVTPANGAGATRASTQTAASSAQRSDPVPPSERVHGSFIVRVAEGLDPKQVAEQIASDYGGTASFVYDAVLGGFAFKGPDDVRDRLARDPRVRGVDDDVTVYPLADRPELEAIKAPEAWNISGGTNPLYKGAGVEIAVLDTKIEVTNPYLGDGDATVGESTDSIIRMSNCTGSTMTTTGESHGTFVTGVAVGRIGVLPMAKADYVKIGTDSGGSTESQMVCGLNKVKTWLTEGKPIRAVNLSWGCTCELFSARDAIADLRTAGVVTAVAAGNGGAVNAPAKYDASFAVSAFDQSNTTRASWSSAGPQVDLGAPGEGITVLSPGGCCFIGDGTSFSAPHAAAGAALVKALNPALSASDVVATLQQSGFVRPGMTEHALNVEQAARGVDSLPSGSFVAPTDGSEVSRAVTLRVAATDDKPLPVNAVEIKIGSGAFEPAPLVGPYYEKVWDTCPTSPCPADPTSPVNVQARVTDSTGHIATFGIALVVDNNDDPPVVLWVRPTDGAVVASPLDVHVTATDDNGVSSAELFVDGVSQGVRTVPSSGSDYAWTGVALAEGARTLSVQVSDGTNVTSSQVAVTVSPALYRQGFDGQPADANDLSSWTVSGSTPLWHFTSACGAASSAPTGAYYGRDASCDYATGNANNGYLTSPWITGVPATFTLEFSSREQVETCSGCSRDLRRIQVNDGNSGWTTLDERNAGKDPGDGVWHTRTFAVRSSTGKVRVRFLFRTVSTVDNAHFGWSIDDFVIKR
jgi:subtilisin